MNDMKVLAELGAALDPPSVEPPDHLRRRVMTATRSPVRRFRIPRLVTAGGLAAVLTGAILVNQVVSFDDHPPASTAAAAEILRGAAATAQRRPAVPVRGDQFIYVESIAGAISMPAGEGATGAATFETRQRRIWLSADGTRDGVLRTRPKGSAAAWKASPVPGCANGVSTARKGTLTVQVPCTASANYHADLPTDADAMLAYLRRHGGPSKNGPDQDAFTLAGDLVREAYLAPAALAALFEAVAKIPGVTVVGDVTDDAGRAGIAVTRDEIQGARSELIFDRSTYAYLGERSVLRRDQDGLKAGQVLSSAAVLKVAVVNSSGRLP
jgi:hypothetical protein